MQSIKTLARHGFVVRIDQDEFASNPRREWSNVGTIVYDSTHYVLGDEQVPVDHMTARCEGCLGHGEQEGEECPTCGGYGEVVDPVRWAKEVRGARVVLGVYAYIHSGTSLSARRLEEGNPYSCPWDSGMSGLVFDTPEGVAECMGDDATDEQIEEALRYEVEVFSTYLNGDVFVVTIDNSAGRQVDCCGDVLGYERALELANELLDTHAAECDRFPGMADVIVC